MLYYHDDTNGRCGDGLCHEYSEVFVFRQCKQLIVETAHGYLDQPWKHQSAAAGLASSLLAFTTPPESLNAVHTA
jgi:hypothetical protein